MGTGISIPFQWVEHGSPLSDAMGAFLATQEMMTRRRERAEQLRQQQEQLGLQGRELDWRMGEADIKRQREDEATLQKTRNELAKEAEEAAAAGWDDPESPNYRPGWRAYMEAKGAKVKLTPTQRPVTATPETLPGDGAPDPREELAKTGGTLGMMLARAGYGVLPEDPNDPQQDGPRLEKVGVSGEPMRDLLLASLEGQARGAEQAQPQKREPDAVDRIMGGGPNQTYQPADQAYDMASDPMAGKAGESVDAALGEALADRRQFDPDNRQWTVYAPDYSAAPQVGVPRTPDTYTAVGVVDSQKARQYAQIREQNARARAADRLQQLAATFPEQPTELMPFAKSDVAAAVGMVRSGAIPVPKIENARDAMEFLADLRAKRQNAETQATGRERAARMAAQRNMDVLGDRALKGRQQALSEFDRVTSSFGIKSGKASSGELKQFASSIDRAEEAVGKFKKSGDVEALGAIKALRNKAIAMDQVGALTEGDVKRGDPVVANFFDRTLDSLQQVFSGPPTVASMRKIIVASRQALNSAYDRHRTAAGAASNHYQDVQRSGVLGLEGARAYASEYNSVFGGIPGVKPLSEQGIVAPDIAGGERRSVKSIEQRSSTETTVKGDVGTVEDLLRRSREVK